MKIQEFFPSKWITPDDLQGKRHRLAIAGVVWQSVGGFRKPVLMFVDRKKGLLLNKTNALRIAAKYGEETDDWPGKLVDLHAIEIQVENVPKASICVTPVVAERPVSPPPPKKEG